MKILTKCCGLIAMSSLLWVLADVAAADSNVSASGEVRMAREALQAGDARGAIVRLENLNPEADGWEGLFWLGSAYLLAGQLDDAAATLDEALAMEGGRPEIWVQRAVVEQERGRHAVSLQFLEVAIQVDAGYALAYLNAAFAWESAGQADQARRAYGQFLRQSTGESGSNRVRRLRRDVIARIAASAG